MLSSCSAYALKDGTEGQFAAQGHGARPYENWECVEFNCEGQAFKMVAGALKSNNPRWGIRNVTLTFREP